MLKKYGVFRLLCCPVVVLFVVIGLISIVSAQAAETVAIIGTGRVGGALGPRFAELGYTVVYGSRDPSKQDVQELVELTAAIYGGLVRTLNGKGRDLVRLGARSKDGPGAVFTFDPRSIETRGIYTTTRP